MAIGKYGLSHLIPLSLCLPITKTGHDSWFYLIMCILWKANEIQNNNASGVCVCVCVCVRACACARARLYTYIQCFYNEETDWGSARPRSHRW